MIIVLPTRFIKHLNLSFVMKKFFFSSLCMLFLQSTYAQEVDSLQLYLDNVEASLNYQQGEIKLPDSIGTIHVPPGFRYLDGKQAEIVLHDLWGNPEGSETLGMIVPENTRVSAVDSWAFIITYDEMGYVKDDDADDIDYHELLEEMQADTKAANEERVKLGYSPVTIVGWASTPFYDKEKKVLHWAKELQFEGNEENTLNYNIRMLGRKGVVVLNAVASMPQLPEVKNNIEPMLASFQFADGNRYSDFNPDVDEVAAWTIGGLVAGKVLAKAGFFAILLKYIKVIGFGLIALGGAAWRWFKKKTEPATVRNIGNTNDGDA